MQEPNVVVGRKVKSIAIISREPSFVLEEIGLTGVIDFKNNEIIGVKLDKHFDELNEWNNIVHIYTNISQYCENFFEEFELID